MISIQVMIFFCIYIFIYILNNKIFNLKSSKLILLTLTIISLIMYYSWEENIFISLAISIILILCLTVLNGYTIFKKK
jgi:hypothetical protein